MRLRQPATSYLKIIIGQLSGGDGDDDDGGAW